MENMEIDIAKEIARGREIERQRVKNRDLWTKSH